MHTHNSSTALGNFAQQACCGPEHPAIYGDPQCRTLVAVEHEIKSELVGMLRQGVIRQIQATSIFVWTQSILTVPRSVHIQKKLRRKALLPLYWTVSLHATLTQGLKIRFSASTGRNRLQISEVNPLYVEVICSKFQQRPFPHS